jgi:alkylhydroperoxidase/carboxymuconolactone decarboxylase family protein YurZ
MSANENSHKPWIAEQFGAYGDEKPIEARRDSYREMIGYVPPRVDSRLAITGALDPVALALEEEFRDHALGNDVFDEKTVQLLVFAMMMAELSDAAVMHALAARRAGASWQELQGVITLCTVFRGVPAANRGADILARAAEKEWAARNEG